jgi:hypothetical protein
MICVFLMSRVWFFDVPDAWECTPLAVEGFAIYKNPEDLVPWQYKITGLGMMPVWFVSRSEYNDAVAGGLTIEKLESLSSLQKGYATLNLKSRLQGNRFR